MLLAVALAHAIDWNAAGDEAARVLSAYLQVDTVNPPGNERAGAEFLARFLDAEGIPYFLHDHGPGRASLVARLAAQAPEGPPICMLSHIDVVPSEPALWPEGIAPLSGAIRDGYVWGRGALDMKGMGVLELLTLAWLRREGAPLRRDVVLLAVADEEVDGIGIRALIAERWDEIGCAQVVNEGGLGLRGLLFEDQTVFGISVAEKGVWWANLVVDGPAGHGSRPDPEQAPPVLAAAMERVTRYRGRPSFHPSLYELFDAAGRQRGGFTGFVLRSPFLVRLLVRPRLMEQSTTRAAITDTINLTGFAAGVSPNVVPSQARATLDARLLPGTTPGEMQARVERLVDDDRVRVEVLHTFEANESPSDDALFRALAKHAVGDRPDAAAGPVLSVGFTDSIYLRPLGVRAYGFVPFEITVEEAARMHGHGERVSLENLREGLRILHGAIHEVATTPGTAP